MQTPHGGGILRHFPDGGRPHHTDEDDHSKEQTSPEARGPEGCHFRPFFVRSAVTSSSIVETFRFS
jgi:hypothetical protein